jgi:regulator of replication initiation timing
MRLAEEAATLALRRATLLIDQLGSLSRENQALRAENAQLRDELADSTVDYRRLAGALVIGLVAVALIVVIVVRL